MHLHEFLAKELLSRRGVHIPAGLVAGTPEDAERAAQQRISASRYAVKAQVHAGDRYASGGIRFAESPAEVRAAAAAMLGHPLITRQTGPQGETVRWVYVEEAINVLANLYVAVVVDRAAGEVVVLGSASPVDDSDPGAIRDSGKLHRLPVDIVDGAASADFATLARKITPAIADPAKLAALIQLLANTLIELDATLIEINPLAYTGDGRLVAVDAKMTVDDNALFRHTDLASLRQVDANTDGDPTELAADRRNVNYITMDGDIGLVVNGAGLALATLDSIAEAGGRAANFMDVRTTATSLDIGFAFGLLLANPAVKAVFLNVHGGGMQRCDTIVEGIGVALRRSGRAMPLVVRLAGNNADFARDRLRSYGVNFVEGASIADAARRAVEIAAREAV
jgi:succinyl-CoA synthetase beta subunit